MHNQPTKLYAFYWNNKTLQICDNVEAKDAFFGHYSETFHVTGKREARAIAERRNAQPWNF